MSNSETLLAGASIVLFFGAGWEFLNRSLFKDYEEQNIVVQVLVRLDYP